MPAMPVFKNAIAVAALLATALPALADTTLSFKEIDEFADSSAINSVYTPLGFTFSGANLVLIEASSGSFSGSNDLHALVPDDLSISGDPGDFAVTVQIDVAEGFTGYLKLRYTTGNSFAGKAPIINILGAQDALLASQAVDAVTNPCPVGSTTNHFCYWNDLTISFSKVASKVSITLGNAELAIDQFTFGPAPTPAIPEPSTWALSALGLLGVGAATRRRQAVTRSKQD